MKADYSENITATSGLKSETGQEIPSRREIWRMFDRIAGRYDLLNRLLSFRQDVRWRRILAEMLPDQPSLLVLDLATGTADVLLSLFRYSGRVRAGIGLDMAENMLKIGRQKVRQKHLENSLFLIPGDAVRIPFATGTFDVITMAFGIRNVQDVQAALQEMLRILKPGGRLLILEFSLPKNRCFRVLYLFYFRHILPQIGGLISGDRQAYGYLNQTVETFPYGQDFCGLMTEAGFRNVGNMPLTLGISSIYRGDKNSKLPTNQE